MTIQEASVEEAAARWAAHSKRCDDAFARAVEGDFIEHYLKITNEIWGQYDGGDEQSLEDRTVLADWAIQQMAKTQENNQ